MDGRLLQLIALGPIGWVIWTIYSRLVAHPLKHIPGPRLAALTYLYEAYYELWHPGQYPFKIKKLHEAYGPIIRPVPDEVHISDPDYLDTIYALRGRNNPIGNGLMVDQSIGGAEDFYLHKMRRDALNPYFSQKFMLTQEDSIVEKRDNLIQIVDGAVGSSKPLNVSDLYFAFSNDLVRNFCFGSDSDLLSNLPEANRQRYSLMRLLTGVKLNRHLPFIASIGRSLPKILGTSTIPPAVMDLLNFKRRARNDIESILNDFQDEKREGRHSIFYELRDNPDLPPEEKSIERLEDEATLLVMAGTESLAKSLQYGTYYLLAYPETLKKLRAELDEVDDEELSLSTLLGLPYLNACITEINRLTFGVTQRMLRYSPTETLSYTATSGPHKGTVYTFPPGTKLSCLSYCANTNEELFPDPFTFDPERFLGQSPEVNKRKKTTLSLGKGHRRCLGMNVANAGMSLVLSSMAQYDMMLFETSYEDVAFLYDYQIAHPRLDTKGIQVIVESRRQ